jgi:hypothetical protein
MEELTVQFLDVFQGVCWVLAPCRDCESVFLYLGRAEGDCLIVQVPEEANVDGGGAEWLILGYSLRLFPRGC